MMYLFEKNNKNLNKTIWLDATRILICCIKVSCIQLKMMKNLNKNNLVGWYENSDFGFKVNEAHKGYL